MTFLPIVERELRVAARRRGIFGMRMKIAGAATLGVAACLVASLIAPSVSFGQSLFWGLSGLCLLYCLLAGRLMTADCLSREKREGTLGLLFLTDLRGYDVVLGKLAATSLDGFYGLIALLPFLAVPLLAGGMTNGELWRMALVLVNTFLFSLTVGLFVSAVSRDEQKVMGANFGLLLLLAGVAPAFAGMLVLSAPGARPLDHPWFYSCPVYSFCQCADAAYKKWAFHFWWSIGTTFALTLLLVLLACLTAPRSWQDKPVSSRPLKGKGQGRRRRWRVGSLEKAEAFRRRSLALNAYAWLSGRPYLKVSYVWTCLGLMGFWWLFTTWLVGNIDEAANVGMAVLLNSTLKLWITTEAGRQLAEDKRSGAFELLLSTPLTERDILRGQWLALRRQFLKPVAVAVIVELLLLVSIRRREDAALVCSLWLAGILMLVADAIALGWVGMSAALTAKNYARATIKTAASVLVLPWVLFGGVELAVRLFMFLFLPQPWGTDWRFDLGCWFGVVILADLFLLVRARRRLQTSFRQLALEAFAPKRRLAWWQDWRTGSPERKSALRTKLRRQAAVVAALLATGAALILYDIHAARAHTPKPLVISISQSNNPVRVLWGNGFLFLLPDGTLWRWGRGSNISPPQQVGTNRDWVQASASGDKVLGMHSDGTLWAWDEDHEDPRKVGSDHDWVEACRANASSFARKRDGTLWAWGYNNQNQLGNGPGPYRAEAVRVGTNRDWKAISTGSFGATVTALRANGTLWTWGAFNCVTNGAWTFTNYPVPIQLCRESNWVGFIENQENGVRNQAGESWGFTTPAGFPGAGVPVAAIGRLLSSNGATIAVGPLFTTNWNHVKYELQTNGTLWWTPGSWLPASAPLAPGVRVGRRSDWVSVWASSETMIAMSSDGTLWTWGLDYGQESHWSQIFVERVGLIREIIRYLLGAAPPSPSSMLSYQYPAQKEPRPLLRLVATNSEGSLILPPNLNPIH